LAIALGISTGHLFFEEFGYKIRKMLFKIKKWMISNSILIQIGSGIL